MDNIEGLFRSIPLKAYSVYGVTLFLWLPGESNSPGNKMVGLAASKNSFIYWAIISAIA